ncbi:MAG: electron transfer flavoprotein [Candidatus Melainabacteria bacterium]
MSDDRMEFDVLLVGASPSSLVLAHRLVDLACEQNVPLTMAMLEKGRHVGANIVSGAVSNPRVLKKLFPDIESTDFPTEGVVAHSHFMLLGQHGKWTVPNALLPPGLKKEGYWVLTLSHVVVWLYERLMAKIEAAENIHLEMLPGFSAHRVVFEGDRVVGVQIVEEATGSPDEDNLYAKVTCFGDKGFVSRQIIEKCHLRTNPQIWSVGVKEVWELKTSKDFEGHVWHTMGFPLVDGTFGGGFVYGMKNSRLTIGLIASLDSRNPNLNPQAQLQAFKKHPWVQGLISGGKLLKYGAAVLPEGGFFSLPKQFQVDGALLLGDALGVLDISGLSGVDKAMETGYQAAEVVLEALRKDDTGKATLADYQHRVMHSFVGEELQAGRYFRYAWQENPRLLQKYVPQMVKGVDGAGPIAGFIRIGLKHNPVTALKDALRLHTLMSGKEDIGTIRYEPDYTHIVPDFRLKFPLEKHLVDEGTLISRPDAVFYADPQYHEGSRHIDEFSAETCVACIARYEDLGRETPCVSDCTAEVHRIDEIAGSARRHGMSLENCVQCRTCELVCPEQNLLVRPTEQGAGPDFMGL